MKLNQSLRHTFFSALIQLGHEPISCHNDIDDFVVLFNLVEITNRSTDSIKVDFSDCVVGSAALHCPNLGPGVVGWIVLEHLQASRTSHHQSKNSTQYLVSHAGLSIISTGYNHLLVQESSSKKIQRPVKNLLCSEQHF